jgi:ribonucleotide monophosphatase NagD (HAD superfamily)
VDQFIQSHTPYQHFSDQYPNVVIFSKDEGKCRTVAERYGFQNVWTATDVNANFPDLWPFRNDHPEDFKKLAPDQRIDAALVFNDPAYFAPQKK